MKEKVIDYIERLEAEAKQCDRYFVERNELFIKCQEKDKEIERLNNIINSLKQLELYTFEPDFDYEENLIENYIPFNIEEYIEELKEKK